VTGITAFIYHDAYLKYQFGPGHPFKPVRAKYTLDLLRELDVLTRNVKLLKPLPAQEEELLLVHSKEFIRFVRKTCEKGNGFLDMGDTPATKGLYEGACSVVGGSLLGARLIMEGKVAHAFNPGGGLHHAKEDSAAGFCVFNDIAVTVRFLQKRYGVKRIVILDVDGHHGDGTQEILYHVPVLKVSTHRIGIFPGTGYVDELGTGSGKGYSVNIPLPRGVTDKPYLYAFKEVCLPLIEAYEPEIILSQFGVDGHYGDPLVGLALTAKTYEEVSQSMHDLAHKLCDGRLLLLGGGGYDIENTVRCWTIMFATISEALFKTSDNRYRKLFEGFRPADDKAIMETVERTVERIKESIFPLHGLESDH
jgi:acetoin utilization protein AcuC